MFRDRADAGRRLAEELVQQGVEADVVLAIPRGGLPIGRPIADELGVPLDIIVAKKIGAPNNPEYAVGAVSSQGHFWLNEDAVGPGGVDRAYVEAEREAVERASREKADRYRGNRPAPELRGETVVIADDGVATGGTATACIRTVREAGARRVVLAVPVGSPRTMEELAAEADEVICLATPSNFRAVGQFYDRFGQVSDEEAMEYLGF
ncbi:Predicted phosphoribosyltransferase [Halopelagius inordinatus]|uniref:Predicted phosphoribosyltransferase n=1 Tax=Halopelagius inordinatus TaxID=553467 RepID=A0A1I2V459_9EURY|nr:phosphoribosyltransferase family protein [Halopelagius inordinatus]SFG84205.1 Predicted phosphoribosyltransferase [Halopelagius inordinatus]